MEVQGGAVRALLAQEHVAVAVDWAVDVHLRTGEDLEIVVTVEDRVGEERRTPHRHIFHDVGRDRGTSARRVDRGFGQHLDVAAVNILTLQRIVRVVRIGAVDQEQCAAGRDRLGGAADELNTGGVDVAAEEEIPRHHGRMGRRLEQRIRPARIERGRIGLTAELSGDLRETVFGEGLGGVAGLKPIGGPNIQPAFAERPGQDRGDQCEQQEREEQDGNESGTTRAAGRERERVELHGVDELRFNRGEKP